LKFKEHEIILCPLISPYHPYLKKINLMIN